jgi:hypothetical protein
MPAQEHIANVSDEPALLRIEGPIATITLNRPAAFSRPVDCEKAGTAWRRGGSQ